MKQGTGIPLHPQWAVAIDYPRNSFGGHAWCLLLMKRPINQVAEWGKEEAPNSHVAYA